MTLSRIAAAKNEGACITLPAAFRLCRFLQIRHLNLAELERNGKYQSEFTICV